MLTTKELIAEMQEVSDNKVFIARQHGGGFGDTSGVYEEMVEAANDTDYLATVVVGFTNCPKEKRAALISALVAARNGNEQDLNTLYPSEITPWGWRTQDLQITTHRPA
jgi:hypothetical protein